MSSARDIARALADRSVKARNGNYLVPCPAHTDDSPSLSLCDGDRGLMVHCFAGCSPRAVYAAIRRKGQKLAPGDTTRDPVKGSPEYERRQHDKASYLWSRRRRITGTIAERYLREARGITCPLPATLAFLPPLKREHSPAMIAAFALLDEPEPGMVAEPRTDGVGSVHLTLLKPDGSGKADTKSDKLIIGSPRGLPIILAPPNDLLGMAVTEGIEDGLSVPTGLGVWCAGAASMMPKLAEHVPSYIEAVTIYAHADQAGRAGAHDLARALQRRGSLEVRLEGLP
jgi:hypothetical protein